MSTTAETIARNQLVARRSVISRSQRHNEVDGANLRQDSRDGATSKELEGVLVKLSDRERNEVDAIDAALSRLDNGTWGHCAVCRAKIAPSRLSAMPEANSCLDCSAAADKRPN